MKVVFFILAFPIIFLACTPKVKKDSYLVKYTPNDLSFTVPESKSLAQIIPGSLADSTKMKLINSYVEDIVKDSTLLIEVMKDIATNKSYVGFFRNDSLVVLIDNKGIAPREKVPSHFLDIYLSDFFFVSQRYTIYFFLADSLVFVRYRCSNNLISGMCNPVSLSIDSHIYQNRVIAQTVNDNVGMYCFCGCECLHSYSPDNNGNYILFERDKVGVLQDRMYEEYDY